MTEDKGQLIEDYTKATLEQLMSILDFREMQIKTLMKYMKATEETGDALLTCLENLYNDYASYYPSAITNSPAMKAAAEFLKEDKE